jgi:hypothetical protein
MEQSKFIVVLQKLSSRQQGRFMEFLLSPYFNKHEDVTKFVKMVLLGEVPLNTAAMFAALYPEKALDSRRVPDLMYKSLKLLEEFLEEEQYKVQSWQRKLNILSYVRSNELGEMNSLVQNEIVSLRDKKLLRDSDFFYEEFLYQSESYKIFLDHASINTEDSLQQKVDHLDLFYLSAKLRESCEMLNRTRIFSVNYDFHLLDDLIKAIESDFERYAIYPAIVLYYRIMQMLRNPEEINIFYQLKDEVQKNSSLFARDEQRSLYGYLQNYCIRKVNSGRAEFYRELLNIYRYMIEAGLMDGANKNLQWDLKNMVSIALRLGEHDWTYKTINLLKDQLPEADRTNAYTYNLANYYYETKDYKKATRMLQSVEFTEVYYNLDSKSMLLKIYFEQAEEDAFYAHVNAFRIYLTRNRLISKDTSVIYGNMVKYARKAFVFKTQLPYQRKKNQKNIQLLKETVASAKKVANMTWLLNQMSMINDQ